MLSYSNLFQTLHPKTVASLFSQPLSCVYHPQTESFSVLLMSGHSYEMLFASLDIT